MPARKRAYTIPCPSHFRDRVLDLARRRGANVGDLARSVLLLVPDDAIASYPDPGGPGEGDRECVTLKSGPAEGRPWQRKPRLQLRLGTGHSESEVRRALAIALAVDRGDLTVELAARPEPVRMPSPRPAPEAPVETGFLRSAQEELTRLRAMVSVLSFEPLPGGVKSRADALHVLGFRPGTNPAADLIRARFRMLAAIHHPDGGQGSHQRMSQLNAAMELLRKIVA